MWKKKKKKRPSSNLASSPAIFLVSFIVMDGSPRWVHGSMDWDLCTNAARDYFCPGKLPIFTTKTDCISVSNTESKSSGLCWGGKAGESSSHPKYFRFGQEKLKHGEIISCCVTGNYCPSPVGKVGLETPHGASVPFYSCHVKSQRGAGTIAWHPSAPPMPRSWGRAQGHCCEQRKSSVYISTWHEWKGFVVL